MGGRRSGGGGLRISSIIADARASLKNPSRPHTPAEHNRTLFTGSDYRPNSRPASSYSSPFFENGGSFESSRGYVVARCRRSIARLLRSVLHY